VGATPNIAAAATAFPDATNAALAMLARGGNAVDAAIAAAFTLAVCEPASSGLGGQTTMLVRWPDGRAVVIDGHSHAPAAASVETITPRQQRSGRRATTVPSTVATLAHAHARFGSVSWAGTIEAAVEAAEGGFRVTPLLRRQIGWVASGLRSFARPCPFLPADAPPPIGHQLRQPALAATLRRIATHGATDFYSGGIAREIATDMVRHGGLVTADDLANLALPAECPPLEVIRNGVRVLMVPSPGGGPTLAEALTAFDRQPTPADEDGWYENVAAAVFEAFASREHRSRAAVAAVHGFPAMEPPADTTHLVVLDTSGTAVSLTQSIQSVFGAKVMHPRLGFFYNNYLRTCPRGTHPHALGSGARPRSNVAPTIATSRDGRRVLALGAAGSRRIVSAVLQVMLRILDAGASPASALEAARVHALVNGRIWLEAPAASRTLVGRLEQRFGKVTLKRARDYSMAAVQAVVVDRDGTVQAAADPRRDGTAGSIQI
jgi:gamma-glutamyltranspeptidase / glutathione hydrolase